LVISFLVDTGKGRIAGMFGAITTGLDLAEAG